MRAQSGNLSADFDRFDENLKRVLVRTEQMDVAATFELKNISEKFSKEGVIDIEHSAGDQDKPNNYNTIIPQAVYLLFIDAEKYSIFFPRLYRASGKKDQNE